MTLEKRGGGIKSKFERSSSSIAAPKSFILLSNINTLILIEGGTI